jgi:ketosteroid isomerase-like protein
MLVLFACTTRTPELTDAQKAEIVNTIEANMNKLMRSAEALDTSALQEFIAAESGKNFFLTGTAFSKEELISATKSDWAGIVSQRLTVVSNNIRVISPDLVLWTAEIAGSSLALDGIEDSLSFTDTWLWERNGDIWQVSHLHESWGE